MKLAEWIRFIGWFIWIFIEPPLLALGLWYLRRLTIAVEKQNQNSALTSRTERREKCPKTSHTST